MAITKPLVTTEVTIHGEDAMTFTDKMENGVTTRDGSNVRDQILKERTIEATNNAGVNVVIPYHAIVMGKITKVESAEYEAPEDAFCVSASGGTEDDGIVLLDGTYAFEEDTVLGSAVYKASLDKCYTSENATVTVDGEAVVLPKTKEVEGRVVVYGVVDSQLKPLFDTYPAVVFLTLGSNAGVQIALPTAGSHTIKVTVPNGSEIECN